MPKCCEHHNCIGELRSDHDVIIKELEDLENNLNPEQVRIFLDFTEKFAEPHHHKEEQVLFPELEKRGIPKDGGPIGVMLLEHETKRSHVRELKKALENEDEERMKKHALAIVALLREHIGKENDVLYPTAEQLLSEEDMEEMGRRCSQIN